jgi:oligopeptide transport system substrate-binding protein
VPDERTLEVRLRNPTPFLPKTMAFRSWFPVPRHVIDKFGDPYQPGNRWTRVGNIVGNGPFILHEWKPNVHIEVRRNPMYWNKDTVRLNGVRFVPMENTSAEEAAFRAGQLHLTNGVPLTRIPVYQKEQSDVLHIHPYSGVYFYNLNVNKPPFTDARVRRALALAVDRPRVVQFVTKAGESPAYNFVPEAISGYVSRGRTRLDFDAARKLLAEAGYPGGQGLEPITLLYNTAENHRAIAEAVQQTWKRELGIDVRLENQEWKVYLATMHSQTYQMARAGLIIEPHDPSQFFRVMTSGDGFNRTGWKNAEYDRLYTELLRTVDTAKRTELMQRMEEILMEEMPILPVYYYTNQFLLAKNVRGWAENLMAVGPYDRVWLD